MSKNFIRILISSVLLAVLVLSIAAPVAAFDGRGGEDVVIAKAEVINDDLYVGANKFTLDGTVNGDVLAGGETITINGTVDGDVLAAGQTVIINGTVTGSVRIVGGALLIGENAKVGRDILGAGGSLETRKGSSIGQDAIIFGGQALLAGDIIRNVKLFAGGGELQGSIGGNLEAQVGSDEYAGPGPRTYLTQSPISIPDVKNGLTLDPAAKIGGKLTYTSARELAIPAGVVAGVVTRLKPVVRPAVVQPTPAQLFINGALDVIRRMVTLILLGLLLGWLFPAFIAMNISYLRGAPLPSLGWGTVSIAAFFFALLVLMVGTILGAILLGMLTLGGLSSTVVFLGLLGLFILIFGFVVATSFVAQIIVSVLGGRLILERVKPEWADHKVWPLVTGIIIFVLLAAIPYLGGLVNLVVVLLGLGALWFYGQRLVVKQPAVAIQ